MPKIWDVIISIHNLFNHASEYYMTNAIYTTYYGTFQNKILFVIKLYDICY